MGKSYVGHIQLLAKYFIWIQKFLSRQECLNGILEMLMSKYSHPPQPCQEAQVDHENPQDPEKTGHQSFC